MLVHQVEERLRRKEPVKYQLAVQKRCITPKIFKIWCTRN